MIDPRSLLALKSVIHAAIAPACWYDENRKREAAKGGTAAEIDRRAFQSTLSMYGLGSSRPVEEAPAPRITWKRIMWFFVWLYAVCFAIGILSSWKDLVR